MYVNELMWVRHVDWKGLRLSETRLMPNECPTVSMSVTWSYRVGTNPRDGRRQSLIASSCYSNASLVPILSGYVHSASSKLLRRTDCTSHVVTGSAQSIRESFDVSMFLVQRLLLSAPRIFNVSGTKTFGITPYGGECLPLLTSPGFLTHQNFSEQKELPVST